MENNAKILTLSEMSKLTGISVKELKEMHYSDELHQRHGILSIERGDEITFATPPDFDGKLS